MFTRTLIAGLIVVLAGSTARGQASKYVCTPCGSQCDSEVYDRAGNCHSCGMALVEKSSAVISNLSIEEVCKRIAANPKIVLLDVRSAAEFSGSARRESFGHFKNAININIDELETRMGELSKYRNDEIVVYCSHSHRSPRATYFLSTQGFRNVTNMAGGVSTLDARKEDECLKSSFIFH